MATLQSTTNLIILNSNAGTARVGQKLRIAGVMVCKTNATTRATVNLRNGASTLQIIPQTVYGSAAVPPVVIFPRAIDSVGLKTTICSNCSLLVFLL